MKIRYKVGQIFCGIVRFGELRVAKRIFARCSADELLGRGLFGSTLLADVSRSAAQQLLYLTGERAVPERFLVRRLLNRSMHVVDVGANIGYYLCMYQQVLGRGGRVTCIEPSPENLKELYANIRVNSWENVAVHECAVGNMTGTVGLRGGVNGGVVDLGEGVFETVLRPLDELVPDRCDFLKIDVDGYEWLVLQGARKMIERDRPLLFLEYHPLLVARHGGSFAEVLSFLRSYYKNLQFFDVPNSQSLATKLMSRYFGTESVREIDIAGVPDERLHEGRLHGTLWILAR